MNKRTQRKTSFYFVTNNQLYSCVGGLSNAMPNMIRLMATQERGLLRDTRLLLPAFVVCYFFVMVRVPGFVMLGIIAFSPTYGAEYTNQSISSGQGCRLG